MAISTAITEEYMRQMIDARQMSELTIMQSPVPPWAPTSFANGAQQKQPALDPNKQASMMMPLSALKDLWAAKYGDTWIKEDSTFSDAAQDGAFWFYGLKRLRAANLMEYIDQWVRLKEENGNR